MGLWQRIKGAKKRFFESFQSPSPRHERPDWTRFDFREYSERFDNYFQNYTKIKSCVLTIAGQLTAKGVFTQASGDYDRAEEAKNICDKFNERHCYFNNKNVGMDILIYETAVRMVKYGTAFWEKDWNTIHGLNVQLIPYQQYLSPRFSRRGDLEAWDFKVYAQTRKSWVPEEIVVFPAPPYVNPPFGTSWLTGIDRELKTEDEVLDNLKAYLEKQAWASNIIGLGDSSYTPSGTEVDDIETKIRNREVGDDFVTSMPLSNVVMGAASIETRMIPDTLNFLEDQITDALNVPPVSKLYNSTEASATVMTDWCRASSITPLQRIIKRVIEHEVYTPYLEDMGYSLRVVPSLTFEPPEVELNLTEEVLITDLVDKGIISRRTAARELGFEDEFDDDDMENWEPPTQFNQQDDEEGGSWKVTELKKV